MTRTPIFQLRRGWRTLLALSVIAGSGGCERSTVATSLAAPIGADDVNSQLDFWSALSDQPIVSNDDGLHALILFCDGQDPCGSYPDRVRLAKERNWLDSGWDEPAHLAMQRGTLARAVAVYCHISGGVIMHVIGPNPRYATRELQYLGMMGPGSEQQALAGRELAGVLSKAQDYRLLEEARKRNQEAAAHSEPVPSPHPALRAHTSTPPPATSSPPGSRRMAPP